MAKVTVYSEPLVEKYGDGFPAELQKMESCSGDGLNIAGAITRGAKRLSEYHGCSSNDKVTLLCGLGDDEHGAAIRDYIGKNAVCSLEDAVTIGGRKSSGYEIKLEEGGDKRSVRYMHRGPDSAMCHLLERGPHDSRTEAKLDNIAKSTDILVITGIGASRARSEEAFAKLEKLATDVRRRGGKVVVDLNHRYHPDGSAKLWVEDDGKTPLSNDKIRERMDRLYALANVAFIAHDEVAPLYGHLYNPALKPGQDATDAGGIVAHLRSLKAPAGIEGPRHIMYKRGKEGGTLYYQNATGNDTIIHTVGTPVKTVDRNGGGDALVGGTVAAMLSGYTLDQALFFGQKMAGRVIQHPGGVIQPEFLPTNEMIEATIPKEPKTAEHWTFGPSRSRHTSGTMARNAAI